MARKTLATDARQAAVLASLRAGNTRTAAAAAAEVHRATLYAWIEAQPTFRDAVEKAEADAEIRFLTQVAAAATNGTWQAAAWWLERRRHQSYALQSKVDLTVDIRREVERIASSSGIEVDAAMAEVALILAGKT